MFFDFSWSLWQLNDDFCIQIVSATVARNKEKGTFIFIQVMFFIFTKVSLMSPAWDCLLLQRKLPDD